MHIKPEYSPLKNGINDKESVFCTVVVSLLQLLVNQLVHRHPGMQLLCPARNPNVLCLNRHLSCFDIEKYVLCTRNGEVKEKLAF